MYRDKAAAIIGALKADQLLDAYERTRGDSGNPDADALLVEIKRRELDV